MVANAIIPFDPEAAVEGVRALAVVVRELREKVFVKDQDYGIIPGTGAKPVLLLPGMEKLMRALRLRPDYALVSEIQDFDKPLFYFRYECRLIEVESGDVVSSAIGSANSLESKWRYRNAARVCPSCGKEAIIKGKEEYGGGWLCFGKKGGCGAKYNDGDPAIEDQTVGRVLNDDIFDQINTIDKIAQKRALGSAIKGAANVSEFFTVDLEDLPNMAITKPLPADAIEGEFSEAAAPANGNGQRNTSADKQRLGNGGPRRVGADADAGNDADRLRRPWTVETLKPAVISLFDNEHNYYAAVKNYRDAGHDEYLLPADVTLAEAEARVRLYRSRTGKADLHVFDDEAVREAFIGACADLLENDRAIIEALDAVADYPVAGLTGWKGDKATAWAAVVAAAGLYVQRAAVPAGATPGLAALVTLICEHVSGLSADEIPSEEQAAFENI